jgi:hypothetical protein
MRGIHVQASAVLRGAEASVRVSRISRRTAPGAPPEPASRGGRRIGVSPASGNAHVARPRGDAGAGSEAGGAACRATDAANPAGNPPTRNPPAGNPTGRKPATRSATSRCTASLRTSRVSPLPAPAAPARAVRFPARAERCIERANAIAAFHGALALASARAANRSAGRSRGATEIRFASAIRPGPLPPILTV